MHYVLSLSKWRCGGGNTLDAAAMEPEDHYYIRGKGMTRLENSDGFMCCLGQFARQVIDQSGNQDLINTCKTLPHGDPEDLALHLDEAGFNGVYDSNMVYSHKGVTLPYSKEQITTYHVTRLAGQLIRINDDPALRVAQKIYHIKKLLVQYGHTLTVVE